MTPLTYEYLSPLIPKLDALPCDGTWYNLTTRKDREQFTEVILQMQDIGLPYELDEHRTRFRKLATEAKLSP